MGRPMNHLMRKTIRKVSISNKGDVCQKRPSFLQDTLGPSGKQSDQPAHGKEISKDKAEQEPLSSSSATSNQSVVSSKERRTTDSFLKVAQSNVTAYKRPREWPSNEYADATVPPNSKKVKSMHFKASKHYSATYSQQGHDQQAAKYRQAYQDHRRPSYEMEDVQHDWNSVRRTIREPSHVMEEVQQENWESLTKEEQRHIMLRHGIPLGSSTRILRLGDMAQITMSIDDLNFISQRQFLYHDVEGPIPQGHPELTERDAHNGPYGPLSHEQELERGNRLSKKPICNAPPYTKDLPWEDMEGITLEEFIIYFPNHVVRWPGLALWLRHQDWDRLFYRTARLINLARRSHEAEDRDGQHIEPLPLMIKVERAIQELSEEYRLADHAKYREQGLPSRDWFEEHIQDKPRGFPQDAGMVTLEEAAGYITGVNEFQNKAFSRRMRTLQPNTRGAKKQGVRVCPLRFPFANAFPESPRLPVVGQDQHQQREDQVRQERSTGWMPPGLRMPTRGGLFINGDGIVFNSQQQDPHHPHHPPPPSSPPRDPCPGGDDCGEFECSLFHPRDLARQQQERESQQRQAQQSRRIEKRQRQGKKINHICESGSNCAENALETCRFYHPSDPGYEQLLINQAARQFGQQSNGNTQSHPASAASQSQRPQSRRDETRNGKKTQHEDAPAFSQARYQLCRFRTGCKNNMCAYGHPAPLAPENAQVNMADICRFGAACNNASCSRNHPSPAQAARPVSAKPARGGGASSQPRNEFQQGSRARGQGYNGRRSARGVRQARSADNNGRTQGGNDDGQRNRHWQNSNKGTGNKQQGQTPPNDHGQGQSNSHGCGQGQSYCGQNRHGRGGGRGR